MIRPAQIRAARELLQWTREELAAAAKISPGMLHMAESFLARSEDADINHRIQRTLETAGVHFTEGDEPGVRMRAKGEGGTIRNGDLNKRRNSDTSIMVIAAGMTGVATAAILFIVVLSFWRERYRLSPR
jgi:transcriptional regulator with XRE-family HTH domain